jgi:hypothetical protein
MNPDPAYLCPKFESYNAAFCPGLGGRHLPGEPVCLYLREAVKPGGEARVRASIPSQLAEAVLSHASELITSTGDIAIKLRCAALRGSQIEQGARLRAAQAA